MIVRVHVLVLTFATRDSRSVVDVSVLYLLPCFLGTLGILHQIYRTMKCCITVPRIKAVLMVMLWVQLLGAHASSKRESVIWRCAPVHVSVKN